MLEGYLIAIVIGNLFFIRYWYLKHNQIINLGSFFNILSILYFGLGIYLYHIIQLKTLNNELEIVARFSMYAVLAYNFGYYLVSRFRQVDVNQKFVSLPSNKILISIVCMAVVTQLYMVLKVGLVDFFLMNRTERFNYFSNNTYLLYVSTFLYLAYIDYAIRGLYFESKKYKRYFKYLFIYLLVWGIATISRNDLLIVFLTIMYILERKEKLNTKKIVLYSISLLAGLFVFKGLMYGAVLNNSSQEGLNFGELINWVRNSVMIINNSNTSYNHFSYWITIKGLLTPFINESEPLSNWFMETYYPKAYANGNKYGFSGVIEGYMMGGGVFTFLHFFITGILLAIFSFGKSWIHMFLTIMSMLILYKLFRSESYNFYRQLFWYGLYPMLLIKYLSKILSFIKS